MKLGKIERVADLRTVWAHEAKDFSKWLAEENNLAMLSEALEIEIALEELESNVGSFNVDIYATEEATGRKIIIENQLEDTNHDHLGKIITYASGKSAEVIIWIVKHARDEHKQAVEWLNQHTDEDIGFFLIEIELWKINDSAPAVKFNVVERPNDWAKIMKSKIGLSETQKLQLEFWQAFTNYASNAVDFKRDFSIQKPQAQHWYNLSIGTSKYHLALTANTQKRKLGMEIYISNSKDIFNNFKQYKVEIEKELGVELDWREARKACRILTLSNGDIKNKRDDWEDYFNWYCEMAIKFKAVAKKFGS